MPKIVNVNLEPELLKEALELDYKRARLEASILAAEARTNRQIETAALREINHYRARHQASHVGRDNISAMRTIELNSDDKHQLELLLFTGSPTEAMAATTEDKI